MPDHARRFFVSPHLDDAVFACGAWIATATKPRVVTIFAGAAPSGAPLTDWDRQCGFRAGDDAVAQRRDEDRAALALLDATPIWLDFRDDQYGEPRSVDVIAGALGDLIDREAPTAVHCPLGLFHSDHRRASDAALALVDRFAALAWHVYADAIYRRIAGAVDARLAILRERRLALVRCAPALADDATARKHEALACYRSQLRALRTRNAHDDVFAREAHWTLARAEGPQ